MKKITLALFILISTFASAQTIWSYDVRSCDDPYDYCLVVQKDNSGPYFPILNARDTSYFRIAPDTVIVDRLRSSYNGDRGTGMVVVDNFGHLQRWKMDSLFYFIGLKYNQPTGTISQYLRGDGSTATFPTIPTNTNQLTNGSAFITSSYYSASTGISIVSGVITNTAPDQTVSISGANGISATGTYPNFSISRKKQETFSGTTNSSGNYAVTFGASYSVAPNIQANIINGTNTNIIKITSITTTGFTVNVVNRTDVVGLLPSYANINGAAVDALVTEK